MRTALIPSRRIRHGQWPCNSCTGATWFLARRGDAQPTGGGGYRLFEVHAGHGQPPRPTAVQKQPGRRYGPAPRPAHLCDYVNPDGTTAGACHLPGRHGGRDLTASAS